MLKKGANKAIYYCFLIFVCSACSDLESDSAINISDEFLIDMYQILDQTSFELILELATDEQFDCSNYQIRVDRAKRGNSIELVINNILEPEVCDGEIGPATKEIKFSEQDLDQRIKFFFTDEIFDEADLIHDASKVELNLLSNNGIKFFINELTKIPANTITLLFEYNTPIEEIVIQEHLIDLTEVLQPTDLLSGYYGYFSVTDRKINAKESIYALSQGAHFDLTDLNDAELDNFENHVARIQESLSDDLNLRLYRAY